MFNAAAIADGVAMAEAIIAAQLESTSNVFVRMHFLQSVGGAVLPRRERWVNACASHSAKILLWTVRQKPGIDWSSGLAQDSGKVWGLINSFPHAE
ncbi:hypothetical protein [Lentzea aerocolonigenes]|uniref:hypothetical protein n=1 Tax=Lentzea aerocolonigenes TaxID=68170 RepID=UPI0018C8A4A6|nr:hypothetical protein [Lentzea aerocolonigenes]